MSGHPVRFTFTLPYVDMRYVGPPSLGGGVAEVSESGVVLRFEFQTDQLAGAFGAEGSRAEARLSLPEIRSAKLKAGWFGGRFVIEARSPSATEGIPGGEQGRVVLKVPRREREAARRAEALLAAGLRR